MRVLIIFLIAPLISLAQSPAIDGFNVGTDNSIYAIETDQAGRILIGGNFSNVTIGSTTTQRNRIARLNHNGILDPTFVPPTIMGTVRDIAVDSNGRILICGENLQVTDGTNTRNHVARLNTDGTIDTSFQNITLYGGNSINAIEILSNGRILIGGNFVIVNSHITTLVARLDQNGNVDTTFQTIAVNPVRVNAIKVDSIGRIIIGGQFQIGTGTGARYHVARLNSLGALDLSFQQNFNSLGSGVEVKDLEILPDGKFLIAGVFSIVGPHTTFGVARLSTNGTVDTGFTVSNMSPVNVESIETRTDGKILIAGSFTSVNSQNRYRIALLDHNGLLDTSFIVPSLTEPGTNNTIRVAKIQNDQKILIGGDFTTIAGATKLRIDRLYPTGRRDIDWASGTNNFSVFAIAKDPQDRIYIAGNFSDAGGVNTRVARFYTDGSVDSAFVANLSLGGFSSISAIAIESSGNILVGGGFNGIFAGQPRQNMARLLFTNGSADPSFAPQPNGRVYSIAVQNDGRIIVGGEFTNIASTNVDRIARINSNGSIDASFSASVQGTGITVAVYSVAIQQNGSILIGGSFGQVNGNPRQNIARLSPAGLLDTSFTPTVNGLVQGILIQPDGKIIIYGTFTVVNGSPRTYIARLNQNGTLDTTFTSPNPNNFIRSVSLQSDGRIIIAGDFTNLSGCSSCARLTRLNSNGTVDNTFPITTINGNVYATLIQEDGKVLIGGNFTQVDSLTRNRLARLTNVAPAFQNLIIGSNLIAYNRTGSSSSIDRVTFEYSTTWGASWNPVSGTVSHSFNPVTGISSYTISGSSIPTNINLLVRIRGTHKGAYFADSSSTFEYTKNVYLLGPTSSGVSISGRVIFESSKNTPKNAIVELIRLSDGSRKVLKANPFGYYSFSDLRIGETYVLQAFWKKVSSEVKVITPYEDMLDLDLVIPDW